MPSIAEQVVQDAAQVDPANVILQAASAGIATAENPSADNILNDIELVINLAKEVRAKLSGVHPSVLAFIKALL